MSPGFSCEPRGLSTVGVRRHWVLRPTSHPAIRCLLPYLQPLPGPAPRPLPVCRVTWRGKAASSPLSPPHLWNHPPVKLASPVWGGATASPYLSALVWTSAEVSGVITPPEGLLTRTHPPGPSVSPSLLLCCHQTQPRLPRGPRASSPPPPVGGRQAKGPVHPPMSLERHCTPSPCSTNITSGDFAEGQRGPVGEASQSGDEGQPCKGGGMFQKNKCVWGGGARSA